MKPRVKAWVAFSDGLKFGEGRARLLEVIDERGSLQQAAKEFEMFYRNAWAYLRELLRAAGFKFVHRVRGGGPRGGMRLTSEARQFLAEYRRFNDSLTRASERCFARAARRRPPAAKARKGESRSARGG